MELTVNALASILTGPTMPTATTMTKTAAPLHAGAEEGEFDAENRDRKKLSHELHEVETAPRAISRNLGRFF